MIARLATLVLLLAAAIAPAGTLPLIHAHAHNDYAHDRPLAEALGCGFCSIEADIHLVNGKLLVAHDLDQARPDRTLRSLYLDPLQKRVRANDGRVYRHGPPVTLLIDIKSDPATTYAALRKILEQYRNMLGHFEHGREFPGAITVILSGRVPREIVASESHRLVACDGSLDDLDANPAPPADLVPQIQAQWSKLFKWRGHGPMSEDDRQRLREIIAKAHAQGRRVRFWDAPDNPAAWKLLRDEKVDLINTDHLEACRDFLLKTELRATSEPN